MSTGDKINKEDLNTSTKLFGTLLILFFMIIGIGIVLWLIGLFIGSGTIITLMFLGGIAVNFLNSLLFCIIFALSIHQIYDMIKSTLKNPKMSYFIKLFRTLKWLWIKDYEIDFSELEDE